jgi:hypothetical protein
MSLEEQPQPHLTRSLFPHLAGNIR